MSREPDAPNREVGVDFDDLDDALEDREFPVTGRELVDEHGHRLVGHQRGAEPVGRLLEPLAEETYESRREVHQAVLSVIGDEAVGRKGYSDRDPPRRDEPGSEDRSF